LQTIASIQTDLLKVSPEIGFESLIVAHNLRDDQFPKLASCGKKYGEPELMKPLGNHFYRIATVGGKGLLAAGTLSVLLSQADK